MSDLAVLSSAGGKSGDPPPPSYEDSPLGIEEPLNFGGEGLITFSKERVGVCTYYGFVEIHENCARWIPSCGNGHCRIYGESLLFCAFLPLITPMSTFYSTVRCCCCVNNPDRFYETNVRTIYNNDFHAKPIHEFVMWPNFFYFKGKRLQVTSAYIPKYESFSIVGAKKNIRSRHDWVNVTNGQIEIPAYEKQFTVTDFGCCYQIAMT
jgi:hypothetical protein